MPDHRPSDLLVFAIFAVLMPFDMIADLNARARRRLDNALLGARERMKWRLWLRSPRPRCNPSLDREPT